MWLIFVCFVFVLLLVASLMLASYVLGQRHCDRATGAPDVVGGESEGSTQARQTAGSYMIAMFFLVFAVEAVLLLIWAVAVREVAWAALAEALIFVAVLLSVLLRLGGVGALDWLGFSRSARRRACHGR